MEAEQSMETVTDALSNRRRVPRFDVKEPATLTLVSHGSRSQCRILDLGLGGCRLHSDEKIALGASTRVEVSFKVNGIVLRFPGVVQWNDANHLVGVRFAQMSSRRRDELAEILAEVNDGNVARLAKEAAAEVAAAEQAAAEKAAEDLLWEQRAQQVREEERERLSALEEIHSTADGPQPVNPVPAPVPVAPGAKSDPRERRAQARHQVDTAAVIQLININSKQTGRVVDLSMGGCRIKTDARFPVGIYTRAETEFYLGGLPFRLASVVQAIHNGNMVGIRFLDMSARKREQLEQLIQEMETPEPSPEKDSE